LNTFVQGFVGEVAVVLDWLSNAFSASSIAFPGALLQMASFAQWVCQSSLCAVPAVDPLPSVFRLAANLGV
jgi:hypothetical protein